MVDYCNDLSLTVAQNGKRNKDRGCAKSEPYRGQSTQIRSVAAGRLQSSSADEGSDIAIDYENNFKQFHSSISKELNADIGASNTTMTTHGADQRHWSGNKNNIKLNKLESCSSNISNTSARLDDNSLTDTLSNDITSKVSSDTNEEALDLAYLESQDDAASNDNDDGLIIDVGGTEDEKFLTDDNGQTKPRRKSECKVNETDSITRIKRDYEQLLCDHNEYSSSMLGPSYDKAEEKDGHYDIDEDDRFFYESDHLALKNNEE